MGNITLQLKNEWNNVLYKVRTKFCYGTKDDDIDAKFIIKNRKRTLKSAACIVGYENFFKTLKGRFSKENGYKEGQLVKRHFHNKT